MNAESKDYALLDRLQRIAPAATREDARTLRRAEMTLHRWHEGECGDSNDYASWNIEVDESGRAWKVVYPHAGSGSRRYRIPNRELGALCRVANVCARLCLHYYVQRDPRGAALYVSASPISHGNYSRGLCCAGRN